MTHYKVYLSLYKNDKSITKEDKDELIKKLVDSNQQVFNYNHNKEKNEHYPYYYDNVYYFGSPIVLTGISKENLELLLTFFKSEGLKFWVTYLYEMFSFKQLCEINHFKNLRMEDINNENKLLFRSEVSLVNEYKNGRGILQDNTDLNKLITATK